MTAAVTASPTPRSHRPTRKPLYLGGSGAAVDARDGALLVRLRGRNSVAMVPITRVDRVVCDGRTDWSGRALELCLRSAVPVVLLDNRGTMAGWVENASTTIPTADTAVESFVAVSGWRARYENWLRSRRMEVLRRVLASGNAGRDRFDRASIALKRTFVYRSELPEQIPDFARGWMSAVAIARLQRSGLRGRYVGYGDCLLDLAGDAAWLLTADLALSVGDLAGAAVDEAAKLRLFESQGMRLAASVDGHLQSFILFIRGQARQWH